MFKFIGILIDLQVSQTPYFRNLEVMTLEQDIAFMFVRLFATLLVPVLFLATLVAIGTAVYIVCKCTKTHIRRYNRRKIRELREIRS